MINVSASAIMVTMPIHPLNPAYPVILVVRNVSVLLSLNAKYAMMDLFYKLILVSQDVYQENT